MRTFEVTERAVSMACSSSVRPCSWRNALSWPMRELRPPARTKAQVSCGVTGDDDKAGDRGQGTADREQGIGDRGQGTGDREQGTGDRGQRTGDREPGTENRGQGTGN